MRYFVKGLVTVFSIITYARTSEGCSSMPLPEGCFVSTWSLWSSCSETCGGGTQERKRNVTTSSQHGVMSCTNPTNETRNCNVMLCPIDCLWGEWSAWGNCSSSGQNFMSRVRNVTRPAMFGGEICSGRFSEIAACQPDYIDPQIQCEADESLCNDDLTCIRNQFKCNGDDDCTDNSDEHYCSEIHSPCRGSELQPRRPYVCRFAPPSPTQSLDNIDNIDIAGAGFNIITIKEVGMILDNLRYNGRCIEVTSGDGGLRLPANLQMYRFQGRVKQNISSSSYESEISFYKEMKKGVTKKVELSISFSFADIVGLSTKVAMSWDERHRTVVEQSALTNSKYFKIKSVIQIAEFRTLRWGLITSHPFRQREAGLPEHYDYVKYSQMIEDFGTHYYSHGVLGGQWEYVYRYDYYKLRTSGLTEHQQMNCFQVEATVHLFGVGIGAGTTDCSSNSFIQKHEGSFLAAAEDISLNVIGGSSNTDDYNSWAETVKDNVAVIDYKLTPISTVVQSPVKRAHMERALYEYLKRFDPENCTVKCENGGSQIVVNDGKGCVCLCGPGYTGVSCSEKSDTQFYQFIPPSGNSCKIIAAFTLLTCGLSFVVLLLR